jgi:hypothetical protein
VAAWEPGDDICPPWPWWWHGPRPHWLDDSVLEVSREVFAGLTLINVASKMKDAKAGLQLARTGAQMVVKQAEQLNRALEKAGG